MTPCSPPRRDYFAEWCQEHPWTLAWIALMTTVNVILNAIQLFTSL